MSVLLIKYAMAYCTADQVKNVFDLIFGADIVENVKEHEKTNNTTGKPFKKFYIHFRMNRIGEVATRVPNGRLDHFIEQIKTHRTQNIIYQGSWYWKVCIAETRVFAKVDVPHIMTSEEERELGLVKAPDAPLKKAQENEEGEINFDSDPVAGKKVSLNLVFDEVISDESMASIMADMKLDPRYAEIKDSPEMLILEESCKKKAKVEKSTKGK